MSTNSLSIHLPQQTSHIDALIQAVQTARLTLEQVEHGFYHPDYSSIRIHYYWESQ